MPCPSASQPYPWRTPVNSLRSCTLSGGRRASTCAPMIWSLCPQRSSARSGRSGPSKRMPPRLGGARAWMLSSTCCADRYTGNTPGTRPTVEHRPPPSASSQWRSGARLRRHDTAWSESVEHLSDLFPSPVQGGGEFASVHTSLDKGILVRRINDSGQKQPPALVRRPAPALVSGLEERRE